MTEAPTSLTATGRQETTVHFSANFSMLNGSVSVNGTSLRPTVMKRGKVLLRDKVDHLQACGPIRESDTHRPRRGLHRGNSQPRHDEIAYCSGVERFSGVAR